MKAITLEQRLINAYANGRDDQREEDEAITAALLSACIEARVWLLGREGTERQVSELDAAINKARGL